MLDDRIRDRNTASITAYSSLRAARPADRSAVPSGTLVLAAPHNSSSAPKEGRRLARWNTRISLVTAPSGPAAASSSHMAAMLASTERCTAAVEAPSVWGGGAAAHRGKAEAALRGSCRGMLCPGRPVGRVEHGHVRLTDTSMPCWPAIRTTAPVNRDDDDAHE